MITARNVISLVIEAIEMDIIIAASDLEYAEKQVRNLKTDKNNRILAGVETRVADATYNHSIGFHSGCAFENKERIKALRRRLEFYKLLDEECIKEELKAEQEEEE